jgi:hypothetical protein
MHVYEQLYVANLGSETTFLGVAVSCSVKTMPRTAQKQKFFLVPFNGPPNNPLSLPELQ